MNIFERITTILQSQKSNEAMMNENVQNLYIFLNEYHKIVILQKKQTLDTNVE